MSTTDGTIRDFRNDVSPDRRHVLGSLRRMAVRLTSSAFWKVVGHLLLDGTEEVRDVEVFSGIGFYARPKKGNRAEALVVFPGGAANPIAVATRDEDSRKIAASIDNDETAMFNTQCGVYATNGGKIEAREPDGTAVELAKASELNNLRAFVMQQFSGAGHVHAVSGAATTAVTPVVLPVPLPSTDYPGTDVLKGQ